MTGGQARAGEECVETTLGTEYIIAHEYEPGFRYHSETLLIGR